MLSKICKDPFRLFFPIAISLALYASCMWILFAFFQEGTYPGNSHARVFVAGFLHFSIVGFLLTAIPRFTKTDFLSKMELLFFIPPTTAVIFYSIVENSSFFWFFNSINWILLIVFGFRRFRKRAENPPYTFLFVGAGVVLSFISSFCIFLSFYTQDYNLDTIGYLLYYDASVLSFILGVGGRLIPGILGLTDIVQSQKKIYEKPIPFIQAVPKRIFLTLVVFICSFILEFLELNITAFILRALVITYFAVAYWGIFKSSKEKSWQKRSIKASVFFMAIAYWAVLAFPKHILSLKHLIYIAGYYTLTLLVASRVTLAHGKEGLELEKRIFPFGFVAFLVLFGAITRASITFLPGRLYMSHLGYAAALLFLATLYWGAVFITKMIKGLKD